MFKDKDHNVGGGKKCDGSVSLSQLDLLVMGGWKSGKCKTAGVRNLTIKIGEIDQIESSIR